MCGIVGYVGKKKAIEVVINGLETLEYRGYDSAGIAYKNNNGELKVFKEPGKIVNLKKELNMKESADLAVGHTRWATHGEPSKINSHPHAAGKITLVHNGIIENYEALKKEDILKNHEFISDTDTEVAAALINALYEETKDVNKALEAASKKLIGSYAFGVIAHDDNKLYAMRKNAPLIIGIGDGENFIASDVPAILKYTKNYYTLDDGDIAVLTPNDVKVYRDGKLINKEMLTFEYDIETGMKNGYDHFMLKEIYEQPEVLERTVNEYLKNGELVNLPDLSKYKRIDIVACGSAYHVGCVAKHIFEEYADTEVNTYIASEYRYKKCFLDKDGLLIVISQSGETADTLASLRLVKEKGIDTLAIVNVVGSSIAREAKNVLYIKAGPEIAVATTKAYTAQVILLSLLAFKLCLDKNKLDDNKKLEIISAFENVKNYVSDELQNIKVCEELANKIYKNHDIFFLGRKADFAIALEGCLKLKEISYLHSEAYQSGELKHGSIALISENTPVISIITDEDIALKTISNIKETKARGAYSIVLSSCDLSHNQDAYDELIQISKVNDFVMPILPIIYLQLIAYYVAKNNGCDIDKPRNLAKSVTVE